MDPWHRHRGDAMGRDLRLQPVDMTVKRNWRDAGKGDLGDKRTNEEGSAQPCHLFRFDRKSTHATASPIIQLIEVVMTMF